MKKKMKKMVREGRYTEVKQGIFHLISHLHQILMTFV